MPLDYVFGRKAWLISLEADKKIYRFLGMIDPDSEQRERDWEKSIEHLPEAIQKRLRIARQLHLLRLQSF
jgi:hypothetical protein